MATCLVTGGAGFLGSHLCEHLLERGNRVVCVDNLETGSLKNIEHLRGPEFQWVQTDITNYYEVDGPVDFIYHMASPASPIDYARLPLHTLKVGSHGTHHTLGVAKVKRARFLLASTSEVYGDPEIHPQPESYWGNVNPIGPRGVYDEAKRYAEALTMAYLRQQGLNTCIARIFNSVLADEQVLYDDGRELRRETAEEAAARLGRHALAAGYVPRREPVPAGLPTDGFTPAVEYPLTGFSVPSFASGGRAVSGSTVALVAHPTDERCFEIHTRYGRSVRVTGHHSVFVEGPDGEPTAKPVEEIEPGERVAVAARIQVPERDRVLVSMLDVWREFEGDPWGLKVEWPGLGDVVWQKRRDVFGLLVSTRRNNGPNWRNGAWTRVIRMRDSDRVPLPVLRRLGIEIPANARVRVAHAGPSVPLPATIRLSDDLLWLLGLWVAEGCSYERDGNAFLSWSGNEALLERAAKIIERELRLRVVRGKASDARSGSIFVHSRLLLRMMEHLGFGGDRKRIPGWVLGLPLARLKWFIEGYREGDGVHSGEKLAGGIRHEFSTVHDELKDDLVVALARFGLVPSVSRRDPFWRLTLCDVSPWTPLEWDAGVSQKLNARRTGDLVWAVVIGVDEVEATPLVYDFSVPGLENFWAGTGVMCHNTYGPRMRPNDGRAIPTFLNQALNGKPITVFGDGSQTRSFCYVDDLIRGLVALCESDLHDPVNIGNPHEMTLLEMAETVRELTETQSEIVFEALPVDDPKVRQPEITRARELLGWQPEIELREGLARTIEHARTWSGVEKRAKEAEPVAGVSEPS